MSTLILPCAGRSTRFQGVRPKWMLTYPDGKLMLMKAIEGLKLQPVDRIIITIVREHCENYDADIVLKQAFGDDVEVCILEDFTHSQSETVALTLEKMNVRGGFISKDSDGYFKVLVEKSDNFIVGADLRKYRELTDVAGKSFIVLNDQNIVIDVIEKSVCSNIISIGMYGFRSAAEYLEALDTVRGAWKAGNSEIYLSHVISYMIGQKNYFSYIEAEAYEDWGLISDWRRAAKRTQTYFIDIDGVVFKNKGKYGRLNWNDEDVPLGNNVNTIKRLASEGAQIVFCTSRPEDQRAKLEQSLTKVGIRWHSIVMGCNHSQRVVINDFANTNPYPSCKAINLHRDSDELDKYLLKNE